VSGMKIKKGDEVVVLQGKDRGKRGRVAFAFPATGKVIVDGVNTATKHQKSQGQQKPGGIVTKDMPMQASNVAVVCNSCGKGVRVGYRFDADGTKVRICRSCEGDLT
jgi:large subunit ribosomal protein L24